MQTETVDTTGYLNWGVESYGQEAGAAGGGESSFIQQVETV